MTRRIYLFIALLLIILSCTGCISFKKNIFNTCTDSVIMEKVRNFDQISKLIEVVHIVQIQNNKYSKESAKKVILSIKFFLEKDTITFREFFTLTLPYIKKMIVFDSTKIVGGGINTEQVVVLLSTALIDINIDIDLDLNDCDKKIINELCDKLLLYCGE